MWHNFNMKYMQIIRDKINSLKKERYSPNFVTLNRSYIFSVFTVFITFLLMLTFYGWTTSQPVSAIPGDDITIVIKAGMNTNEIGELLYNRGLIKSKTTFKIMARFEGLQNSLQAGDYVLKKNMDIKEIVQILSKGQTTYVEFTIPEGYTVDQIAKHLEEINLANSTRLKSLAQNSMPYGYINVPNNVKYKAEGFIFPDTYKVPRSINEEALLQMMMSQFNNKFTQDMRERAKSMNLSVREVTILASLVEKEAKMENERAVIAAVFLNRLKRNMPLQSCATIQYILGYPKPELTIQDTEIPSSYNTYQNMGLPPGPIANPGLASIKAVLYPADTDYLFFVADKEGVHHFSKTYEEHLMEIEKVQN